jgi:FKBP-type peptidyl-prolyl cis-trans isomerase SlyD
MRIAKDCVVNIHYTLTIAGGEVVDSSEGKSPLSFLHGHDQIIPGLERQLDGLEPGAKVTLHVPCAEAYGPPDPSRRVEVPKRQFSSDVDLSPGTQVIAEGGDGGPAVLTIIEVKGDNVVLDTNHPLAGEDLTFDIEVVGVRTATPQELSHGHSHDEGHDH